MTSSSPIGPQKPKTILDRNASVSSLSPTQNQVDHLVETFTDQATNPKTLAAMVGGGLAGRLTRLSTFSLASSLLPEGNATFSLLARGSSYAMGLAGESAAFTGINRGFILADGQLPTQSFGTEWLNSAISLGSLRFFGKVGEGQSPLFQHLMADTGMVASHQVASLFKLEEKPEGDLFSQFLNAEAMNWQMKAGMGLVHEAAPKLVFMERALDRSLLSQESEAASKIELPLLSRLISAGAESESPGTKGPRERSPLLAALSVGLATLLAPQLALADNGSHSSTPLNDLLLGGMIVAFTIWGGGMLVKTLLQRRNSANAKGSAEALQFGKSTARIYEGNSPNVSFKDVAGAEESKEELKEVVDYFKNPAQFQAVGAKIPKGVLMVGPPGTGKTLLAKAVAGEAGIPFFSLSGSEFVEMFVGVGAARIRDLFKQAQKKAPCIIFIDELDAIGRARGTGAASTTSHPESEQTLNQLLTEMDGFDSNHDGVVVLAATNRPEILDSALLRAGRFDRHITVDKPTLQGRIDILNVHARKRRVGPDVDLGLVAQRTPGFVGADLENIVNEAALLAARKGKTVISMDNFEKAIDRVIAGAEKKGQILSPQEKERTAYHESGHTVVAMNLPKADPVHKVSIIPRGIGALGFTLQLPEEDRHLHTRSELLDKLTVLLGGMIAEELIYEEPSTGASNDLTKATEISRKMVKVYGMSSLGRVVYENDKSSRFLEGNGNRSGEYSEKTAQRIDEEIQKLVDEAAERAKKILSEHMDQFKLLTNRLLQKEVVERDELNQIFSTKPRPRGVAGQ